MNNRAITIESELGMEKRCVACEQYWPADLEFYSSSKSVDGLAPRCRACVAERFRGSINAHLRAGHASNGIVRHIRSCKQSS